MNGASRAAIAPAVEMIAISKSFGAVKALDQVDFSAAPAEVHALLGENGAGKTTLMNILAGTYLADSGKIRIAGLDVTIRSPRDAVGERIRMVKQHFELVDALSGLDNILLGVKSGWWSLAQAHHRRDVLELAERHGFKVDLDRQTRDLEVADRQKVEILRVLYTGASVLILDEPTTHLTPTEIEGLFAALRQLAADGLTVILIAHKLHEVLAVADRITVLRRGQLAGRLEGKALDAGTIVNMMLGDRRLEDQPTRRIGHGAGGPLLEVRGVSTAPDPFAVRLKDLAFDVKSGELVGVAGVGGNGQRELVELLAGLRRPVAGTMRLGGRDLTNASVADRLRAGVAVMPGDRIREGILPSAPIYESFALGLHQVWKGERWRRATLATRTKDMMNSLGVAASGVDVPTADLSGGNIQKVIVGRALAIAARTQQHLLVVHNPTSGLDVAATRFVHGQLIRLCDEGAGALLVSEDLDELLSLCDRILVLYAGQITGAHERGSYDRYRIGAGMVGRPG